MAPEAVSGGARAESDWYALGVMLYEALTGQLPCRGTALEVLLAKQDAKHKAPHEIDASIPQDLSALCLSLLSQVPELRSSGEDVLRALTPSPAQRALRPFGTQCWVGRKAELAQLRAAFVRSREGPVVVRVQGATGVGKSALCAKSLEELAQLAPDALLLESGCPRYPERPHAPFGEALLRLCEVAS